MSISKIEAVFKAMPMRDSWSLQAYLLKGVVEIDGDEIPVKLVSMQNPITKLNGHIGKEISVKALNNEYKLDIMIH